ncbi:MAG: hypothetical protein IJ113_07350 [Eggerthellaceae bacterium]|nr:hypothetical protein [Eggerthellaceae bacterium]
MNTVIERQPQGSVKPAELSDWLVSHGVATVTTEECAHLLGVAMGELSQRLTGSRAKTKIVSVARGLWAAVPAEYREAGAPEPVRYVDGLMDFYGCSYCVGWLSAAALYGASHQAPQVFQVATERQIRDRQVGRSRLEFHARSYVRDLPKRRVSLSAGSVFAATPEATMLMVSADLLYSGGIDNAATVVAELADEADPDVEAILVCAPMFPDSAVCRLGWLLDHVAGMRGLEQMSSYCRATGDPAMLSPYAGRSGPIDKEWNVIVNREVEADV